MNMETLTIYHLVKSEDLNHHGTLLLAGELSGWWRQASLPLPICCRRSSFSALKSMVWSLPGQCTLVRRYA